MGHFPLNVLAQLTPPWIWSSPCSESWAGRAMSTLGAPQNLEGRDITMKRGL